MSRRLGLALGLALIVAIIALVMLSRSSPVMVNNAEVKRDAGPAEIVEGRELELAKLLAYFNAQGIELRAVEDRPGGYIQQQFTIGPDHTRNHRIGLNYLPPLTLAEATDQYMEYSLPYEFHGHWALFTVGGVSVENAAGYDEELEKIHSAFKKYSGPKASK